MRTPGSSFISTKPYPAPVEKLSRFAADPVSFRIPPPAPMANVWAEAAGPTRTDAAARRGGGGQRAQGAAERGAFILRQDRGTLKGASMCMSGIRRRVPSRLESRPWRALFGTASLLPGRALLHFLFPSCCAACGAARRGVGGGGLCRACWQALPFLDGDDACQACALPSAAPLCRSCRGGTSPVSRAAAVVRYAGVARRLVHALKFRGHDILAAPAGALMAATARARGLDRGPGADRSGPLHDPKEPRPRLRPRGPPGGGGRAAARPAPPDAPVAGPGGAAAVDPPGRRAPAKRPRRLRAPRRRRAGRTSSSSTTS